MKKSDKLLLLVVLAVLTLFGSAHLNLYWKYKHGMAVSTDSTEIVRQSLPAPAYLSIKGFQTVTLIPANSFAIEYKQDRFIPSPAHYLRGDTLMLSGFDTTAPVKEGEGPRTTEFLRIYYKDIRLIRQESGFMILNGDTLQQHTPLRLQVEGVSVTTGMPETGGSPRFGELSINALHSNVTLFNTVSVHQLKLQLDSGSGTEIQSTVDQLFLDCDENSRVGLTGAAFKKLQATPPAANPTH